VVVLCLPVVLREWFNPDSRCGGRPPSRLLFSRGAEVLSFLASSRASRAVAAAPSFRCACMRAYVHFVCVCLYMCMCVCVWTCTYVYICICVCICICMHLYTCVYVCVCIFLCIDCRSQYRCFSAWIVSCMRMCIRVHMYMRVHMCVSIYVCAFFCIECCMHIGTGVLCTSTCAGIYVQQVFLQHQRTHLRTHSLQGVHICMCVYMCICTHIYMYSYVRL